MITIEDKSEYKNESVAELTRIIFKECGLEGELEINEWYIDRIYITGEEKKWTIRLWNIRENNKGKVVIDWTLYVMRPGSSAEESVGSGKAVIKIK